jgi:hypothetical protein
MDPYLVERMATARHAELAVLAQAGEAGRRYRRDRRAQAVAAGEAVPSWRLAVGRRLVAAGLRVGLPARHRPAARRDARVLLDDCCSIALPATPPPT